MKPIILLLLLVIFASRNSKAQNYTYQTKNPQTGKIEKLILNTDKSFEYIIEEEWTTSKTKGYWEARGKEKVILNSNHQLDDYYVIEDYDPSQKGIQVIIAKKQKGHAPMKMEKIFFNNQSSFSCTVDQEQTMKAMEARHQQMLKGGLEVQDSLRKTELPKHYLFKGSIANINLLHLHFDERELIYEVKRKKANVFIVITDFGKGKAYRYMKNKIYTKKTKKILQEEGEGGLKLKVKK